jgi:hypothetical protein
MKQLDNRDRTGPHPPPPSLTWSPALPSSHQYRYMYHGLIKNLFFFVVIFQAGWLIGGMEDLEGQKKEMIHSFMLQAHSEICKEIENLSVNFFENFE